MSERLLREYIRQQLDAKEPLNELLGIAAMAAGITGIQAIKWLMEDAMDKVEDGVGSMQGAAEELKGASQAAIEGIKDDQIRRVILQQAQAATASVTDAFTTAQQQIVAALQGAAKDIASAENTTGEEQDEEDTAEAAEKVMDEDEIQAAAFLAMSAMLAKVTSDFSAG